MEGDGGRRGGAATESLTSEPGLCSPWVSLSNDHLSQAPGKLRALLGSRASLERTPQPPVVLLVGFTLENYNSETEAVSCRLLP